MPVSEARRAAARANGARSRGALTPETRAISARNATKHAMTAATVPLDDAAEVERRARAMQAEMAPKSEMGAFLVQRLAELTVRVERCSRQERAANKRHVARAGLAFDEARLAEVDGLMDRIGDEPAACVRKLCSMPEGVDRLVAALLGLRDELGAGSWDRRLGEKLVHLTGARPQDVPTPRALALSEAVGGDFGHLRPGDGVGLAPADRVGWARQALAELIDAEVEMLREHRTTLDLEAIEADRAGAADRALFDPSKEATLARRYEAAAERGVYKALAELRRVEAEAEAKAAEAEEADESLGSFGAGDSEPAEGPSPAPRPATPAAPTPPIPPAPAVQRWNEGPQSVGRGPC